MKRTVSKEQIGSKVTVAVVQAASVAFDRKRTLAKALGSYARCGEAGRKAGSLSGSLHLRLSAWARLWRRVGWRTDAGREDFKRYFESAVEVPGPTVDALSKAARANSVYLVMGVIERERGTLYCCVLFFAPDGTFLGKHRKVMPTASERLIWGYGDGSTLPVFDTPLGKLGAVICWENYMPLLRTFMYSQGIEIYCAPTADHRPTWSATMQHIAAEGRCFVLGCNQFNRRRDFPKNYATAFGEEPERCSRAAEAALSVLLESSWQARTLKMKQSWWLSSTAVCCPKRNLILTWWGITPVRISSASLSTTSPSLRFATVSTKNKNKQRT